MQTTIFEIEQLNCAYSNKADVLQSDSFSINSDKIVFVVGASGSGKSTFLESLGLMNRTLRSESKVFFHTSEEKHDLGALWIAGDRSLNDFRRRHFSFIFQQTNLMPNFTCGENMILPALLKGVTFDEAMTRTRYYMDLLNLPGLGNKDIFHKRVVDVSGGQRQRIAFIRAICSEFSVLFGDEPTGNLDPLIARSLMNILVDLIRSGNKTAVIVSHDMQLALEYADMIIPIVIQRAEIDHFGNISKNNIMFRMPQGGWSRSEGNLIDNPTAFLNHLIASK